jgi:competence protein ComFC
MAATSYQEPALKELVHSFKYKRFIKAQKPLGKLLVNYLLAIGFKGEENLIVPIPLHPARERTRGFNQAEVIAKLTADYLKLPVVKVLKRVRKTSPQIDLPKELREENVKNAFDLIDKSVSIKGKSVILVDDVYTTGATMKEAAKVLKKNGVKEIKFLVLAKTD